MHLASVVPPLEKQHTRNSFFALQKPVTISVVFQPAH